MQHCAEHNAECRISVNSAECRYAECCGTHILRSEDDNGNNWGQSYKKLGPYFRTA